MLFGRKRKEEEGDGLKHVDEVLIGFERVIKIAERIYCSKCWSDKDVLKGKLKAAIKLMEETLEEYNVEVQYAHYEGSFMKAGGKVEGMEEAIRILEDVMK